MPVPDLDLLTDAARAAGTLALPFWEGENKVWDKGRDDPVTEADYAVDTLLRETLTAARPDYGWLSEETEDGAARLAQKTLFIVDPIDGTRAFVAGQRTWAHSLAIVENGQVTAGVVYLPALDKLYRAERGGGATLNGAPLTVSDRRDLGGASVLASRPAFEPRHWPGGLPKIERHFRPSLAYRLCLVAEGRFDAMLTLRDSWEWDIAAGGLIAEEAGAKVTDRYGELLNFNNPHPVTKGVLTSTPALHDALSAGLNG
ncbi:MAG: 3'(2'),5'-bisphosphate nucleotidase CysQ [Rhodobacteraceae bacterium]|nr:3'(2'),5'-bisphosphate nucleotidase CysQ [Alphaproteobacteria bacterium]MBT8474443.1 3'(2'),5'-bisphosphate nucleotidase CysQ [Alphaproteobacteria bacterium]NNF72900.1 3'(2'),5'-bisphosphate nucleotidase CysQ [Paracoccaceae bacterium]NNK65248.1 3'(2'),5'-bisphosphate nucleotidase CysQ [Paracoccaceae bacterium]